MMESSALQLLLPSSSNYSSWTPRHHSAAVLHFASRSLFSRPPSVPFRTRATPSEEDRWLREEQRWLREEQRWLREEARWHGERRLMADELALLKREMQLLRAQVQERRAPSLPSVVANLKQLVQSFPASTEQPRPNIEFVEESFVSSVSISSDHPSMSEFSIDFEAAPMQPRRELRNGDEGEDVKALHEALEALGFYSGEEDIEYSMFAEGTETAVKTLQASVGMREDGIASPELLAILFGEATANPNGNGQTKQLDPWKTSEDKKDVQSPQDGETAANRRVYLLGENRWEEPGRLKPRATQMGNGATTSTRTTSSTTTTTSTTTEEKCFECKGEGVSMCTECEGTGELNVEDQFLGWVEEGAKCPYCEGTGVIPCDVCLGRGAGFAAPAV